MNQRIPLDHLTSDALDALYEQLEALQAVARGYCPACGRGDAAPTVADWEAERRRADRADESARRALEQRQEMAEERYAWQERGDRAEAHLRHLQASSEAAGILLTRTTDERDRLRATIERVRTLHQPAECVNVRCKLKQWCIGCDPHGIEGCDENPWPCPTITALDQPAPAATQATEPATTKEN